MIDKQETDYETVYKKNKREESVLKIKGCLAQAHAQESQDKFDSSRTCSVW